MIINSKTVFFGLMACSLLLPLRAEVAVESMTIEHKEVPSIVVLNGQIEAINRSTVSAQTNGSIETLNYDVGDFVEKDAVIARIKSNTQEAGLEQAKASVGEAKAGAERARASYRSAQARAEEASADFKRVKKVYDQRLISRSEYDRSAAAMKSAKAEVGAAKAAFEAALASVNAAKARQTQAGEQLGYTEILAPYSGIVVERHVELGELVSAGKPIMTGISLTELRVATEIPQRMVKAVREHKQAFVIDETGNPSEVSSLTIFPYADSTTNAFRVRARLPDDTKDIYPGTFVKIAFTTGKQQQITIPESAIAYRGEVTAVYVMEEGELPVLRQIRLGKKLADGHVVVLSGLDSGEMIAQDPTHATLFLKRHMQGQEQADE